MINLFNEDYPPNFINMMKNESFVLETIDIGLIKGFDWFVPKQDLVAVIKNQLLVQLNHGVTKGSRISPLVIAADYNLRDGFHRYAALKSLNINRVKVFRTI